MLHGLLNASVTRCRPGSRISPVHSAALPFLLLGWVPLRVGLLEFLEHSHGLGYVRGVMKNISRTILAAIVGGVGLTACDPAESPEPVKSLPVESEAVDRVAPAHAPEMTSADDTVTAEIRKSLAEVMRDPDAFSRARKLGALLPTLGPEGVEAAAQTLKDEALNKGPSDRELLVRYWATHQPENVANWSRFSPPLFRMSTIIVALAMWAEADPAAALSASEQWMREDPTLSNVVPIALVTGWYANGDSPELGQWIQGLGASFTQQRAIATYVRVLIQSHGRGKAEHWAQSLSDDDGQFKLAAYRQVASALPLFDHDSGIAWCEAHCEGPYGKNLRSLIARQWAYEDGEAAVDWILSAPQNKDNDLALRATYALWGRSSDRQAALHWMASRIAGQRLDPRLAPILPVYALLVTEDSPSDAIEFAMRIEDEVDRANVLVLIVREWRNTDPDASEAWLLQSPLTPEERDRARSRSGQLNQPEQTGEEDTTETPPEDS